MKRVLITRDKAPDFTQLLVKKGVEVIAKSFIHTAAVPVTHVPPTDWIFFSSKRAVRYFLDAFTPKKPIQLGAIGKGTATAISERGLHVDFIGASEDTQQVGNAFNELAAGKTVLFPQGNASLKTVQQSLNKATALDLVVYETSPKNVNITGVDVGVFTSPSNVNSFADGANEWPPMNIAIGKSTGARLAALKVPYTVAESFDEHSLARAAWSELKNA